MIELKDLQKIMDRNTVIDIPFLEVKTGEIAALVGPVDSGKDIAFQLLTGRVQPSSGSVRVAGLDPYQERNSFSRQVGVLFPDANLYKRMSGIHNLRFFGRLHALPKTRTGESMKRSNKDIKALTPAALHRLMINPWPGNVRELENAIEKAVVMSQQEMLTPDLFPAVSASAESPLKPLTEAKEEFERTYLKNVLHLTGGNISRAAQFAERYRADFYKMLRKYGLHPSTTKGRSDAEVVELEGEEHLTKAER